METPDSIAKSGTEILIVEDSPTQSERLKHILELNQYCLATARNGREAFAALAVRVPSLVISDVVMPEMDGFELCRQIKRDERFKDLPVILLTSLNDPVDVVNGLECGADNFIFKPYDEYYLLSRVAYLLAHGHLRETERTREGVDVFFSGRKFHITSDRLQILNLLLSTFEGAVERNRELTATRDELRQLNETLERKVEERAAELARANESLRHSEARLQTIVEHLAEGVAVSDLQGQLLFFNRAALDMHGFATLAECQRRLPEFTDFFELAALDGEVLPLEQWPLARILQGEKLLDWELRVRHRADGWERIFSYGGTLVRDADGQPLLAVVAIRDITAHKRTQDVLRQTLEELEHRVAERTAELQVAKERAESADRLKSAFLATMSHELRTPLNSIIGFTGILLQGLAGSLNDEQRKQLGLVQGSARHLLALINDVLDLSKIEAGEVQIASETFDLQPLVEGAVEIVRPLAQKKNLRLCLEMDATLPAIESDARRVQQVLLNLLNNAVKFTSQGEVTLRVQAVEAPAPAHPTSNATTGNAVCFIFRDTGIGIRPEDMKTLFRPFQQIDSTLARQHEGTGLGLAICRRLADMLGGQIRVESEWGKGSTFYFTLPLRPAVKRNGMDSVKVHPGGF